jgi:protein ImuB
MTRIACLITMYEPAWPALLRVALAHSPRVEDAGAGRVYLDASGLEGLFGDEPRLAARLRDAAAVGVEIRVGIAESRIAALAAARLGPGVMIVAPGGDAAYLAPAPLSLLDLPEETATRLSRWGLRTLGELAALPTAGLFERLGGDGVRLQRLARGEDPRPLVSWRAVPLFEESTECEWGLETLEAVGDRLRELAGRVCARLGAAGLAADGFEWTCQLGDGRVHEGALTPAVPMTDADSVGGLLRLALEARPPRGVVLALTFRARPVRLAATQESLTDRSRPAPRLLTATLNRLVALVGADAIGAPALLDTHRPDAIALATYHPHPSREPSPLRGEGRVRGEKVRGEKTRGEKTKGEKVRGEASALALRRLRPPAPASVTLASGRPVAVRSGRLTGRIVAGVGPWRVSGEWWSPRPWLQDEWDVELADGTLCRLAHDGSAWRLEGIYD